MRRGREGDNRPMRPMDDRTDSHPADSTESYPLDWIDDYAARIRDFVVVREEDSLLIKVPNEAHKLNPSGVRLLQRLFAGEGIHEIWRTFGETPAVRRDLYQFFIGLKQVLQGCLDERRPPEAVDTRPFSLEFNTLPVLSEVALTYRCNLRCAFCYAACSCHRGPEGHEMTTDEARRILQVIREEAQIPSVSFTGGEPTLREDLPGLVRYARHDLGMRVNLITNGTRVDEALADRLAGVGLHSAQVSVESHEPAVHDELTGMPGSHRLGLAGMARLQERGIRVHTNTTLNRLNALSAPGMPAFVRGLGLERFSMNLVIPAGSGAGAGADLNLRYSEIPNLLLQIQREARRNQVEFMWYSPTPVCIFNPIQHRLGNKGCAACDGLLSVAPSGDVLPCSSWAEPVGNLLTMEFRTVWNSARARWLRAKRFAPALCAGCADFALCQGGCPLYWEHFGYEEAHRYGESYAAANR